jgi:leader peptidase (prepilin peptidase) / N-methyltransferase
MKFVLAGALAIAICLPVGLEEDLRPNWVTLAAECGAIALVSAALLSWPVAVASIVLGGLMVAGGDVDARMFLLPYVVTWGTAGCGVLAAAVLDQTDPWFASAAAFGRAISTALILVSLRWCYAKFRGREGLGFGHVKLAAAVGAWVPVQPIPLCFGLAAGGALVTVLFARLRGETIDTSMKITFGTFLCPALRLVFYASVLPS